MENFETIVIVSWALVIGYAIRDFMQIHKDHKENMRRIDEAYERAKRQLDADVNGARQCLLGNSFWSGFCPKCRDVHGPGECAGKWRNQ